MKLYADLPAHRLRQLLGDGLLVVWVAGWSWVGVAVHGVTMKLAVPGERIDAAAGDLADRMRDAGSSVSSLPVVGDRAATPLNGAGDAADQLAAAGRAQAEAVSTLAWWLAVVVAVVPILIVCAVYLPLRIRFVRRATAGRRFLDSAADLDLFALRALANQPLHVLARISDDPARAWRAQDPVVVRHLAALELKDVGLRPRA